MNFKKIKSGILHDTYIVIDQKDFRIVPLLVNKSIYVKFTKTYNLGSKDYHVAKCIVMKKDTEGFEECAKMLPHELKKLGYPDYGDFCIDTMKLLDK